MSAYIPPPEFRQKRTWKRVLRDAIYMVLLALIFAGLVAVCWWMAAHNGHQAQPKNEFQCPHCGTTLKVNEKEK